MDGGTGLSSLRHMDLLLAAVAIWFLGNVVGAAVWVLLRRADVPAVAAGHPAVAPDSIAGLGSAPAPRTSVHDQDAARPTSTV